MTNSQILDAINQNIKRNENKEITGVILNSVLRMLLDFVNQGFITFSDIIQLLADSKAINVVGSINTTTNTTSLPSGVYHTQTSGTYTNASGIVVKEGYYTLLRKKDDGSWVLESEVKMPMQDLTKIETELEITKTKVDDFIRDFAVTTDTEFDANSKNPIANSAVTPLATMLSGFLTADYEEVVDADMSGSLVGLMPTNEILLSDNGYRYKKIILDKSYTHITLKGYRPQVLAGGISTHPCVFAVSSSGVRTVLIESDVAGNPQTVFEKKVSLPANTSYIYINWSNFETSLNQIPTVTLNLEKSGISEENAVKKYIDSSIENVQIGEEINGRNLFEIADKNDNPILEIDTDGVLKVKGLETDIIKRSVNASSTNLSGIVSDEPKINLPKPNHIAKVVIHGFPYNVDLAVQDEVECMLEFNDRLGNGFNKKAIVAVQGSTSQGLPKKNLAIDLFNSDDSEFFVQFGDWVSLSSFRLKAEYWCVWHYRSLFASQFFEQMDMSRPWHLQKPWRAPYSVNNATYNQRFNTGARGHIDGFPIEVYIEDTFIGIYNFNQKKHRSNYEMTKDNLNQIIVDSASTFNAYFKNDIETAWEIRNPSGLLAIDGTKYAEGKELSETDAKSLEVKNKIKRFFGWGKNVAVANLKAEAPNYLHIERTIDWFLHCHFLYTPDNYIRNTIWCTWDGLRWAPMVWDLEAVLGMGIFGYANEIPPTKIGFVGGGYNHADGDGVFNPKFYQAFKTEIEGRYKELRDLGIFTTKNVSTYFINREKEVPYEIFKKDMDMMLAPTNRPPNSIFPDGHTGGFFDSVPRIEDWLNKRIVALDAYFKYTN